MNAYPVASLGEVVQINPRAACPDGASLLLPVTFVPMSAVSKQTGSIISPEVRTLGEVSKGFPAFAENDVLFAKITPCMENGKAAIARGLVNGVGAGSTEFFVLRPKRQVLADFIFHFYSAKELPRGLQGKFHGHRRAATSSEIVSGKCAASGPLNEQRRIVEILNRAAEIRRRADAARAKGRAIISALFLDTFGDPATNPRGRPIGRAG